MHGLEDVDMTDKPGDKLRKLSQKFRNVVLPDKELLGYADMLEAAANLADACESINKPGYGYFKKVQRTLNALITTNSKV